MRTSSDHARIGSINVCQNMDDPLGSIIFCGDHRGTGMVHTISEQVEEMSTEQREAMSMGISIPLVIDMVLSQLDCGDLMSCRLVNSLWSHLATQVVKRRDHCKVSLEFDFKIYSFVKCVGINERTQKKSLQDLIKLTSKNPQNFPCTDYSIGFIGNLEDKTLNKFFRLHGKGIKTLSLIQYQKMSYLQLRNQVLCSILVRKAPNIQKLLISGINCPNFRLRINLPKLHQLNWTLCTNVAHNLIRAATNLKKLESFDINRDLFVVLETRKICHIRDMLVTESDSVWCLRKFAACGPQLKMLDVQLDSTPPLHFYGAVEALLVANQETLTAFRTDKIYTRLRVPILTNVVTLALRGEKCFPIATNFTTTFPDLERLDLSGLKLDYEVCWSECFPDVGTDTAVGQSNFPKVKSIHISCWRTNDLQKISLLCPNLKNVTVSGSMNLVLKRTLPLIFKHWKHLEELELVNQMMFDDIDLDSSLTGFSPMVCGRLNQIPYNLSGIPIRRKKPGIKNLKSLKILRLTFDQPYNTGKLIMTRLSVDHGFGFIPGLRINIDVPAGTPNKHVMLLENLSPDFRVTVRPKKWTFNWFNN